MEYEVIVTPFAESALQEHTDYLRLEFNAWREAEQWLEQMEQEILELSILPYRYPLVTREPWHSQGVRFHSIMGYNIYYWIYEEKRKVFITDVVSQRMNQDKRLVNSLIAFYQEKAEED